MRRYQREYNLNEHERYAITYYTERLNDQLKEIDLLYNDIHVLRNEVRNTRQIIDYLMHVRRDQPNTGDYSYVTDFIIPITTDIIYGNTRENEENRNIGLQTEDLNRNITQCVFSEINNPLNTSCPIQLYNFNADSSVSRINHCGHIFDRIGLNRWFERNTRCPICRYNLSTPTPTNRRTSSISQIWMDPSLNALTENILGTLFNRNSSESLWRQPVYSVSRQNNTNDEKEDS